MTVMAVMADIAACRSASAAAVITMIGAIMAATPTGAGTTAIITPVRAIMCTIATAGRIAGRRPSNAIGADARAIGATGATSSRTGASWARIGAISGATVAGTA